MANLKKQPEKKDTISNPLWTARLYSHPTEPNKTPLSIVKNILEENIGDVSEFITQISIQKQGTYARVALRESFFCMAKIAYTSQRLFILEGYTVMSDGRKATFLIEVEKNPENLILREPQRETIVWIQNLNYIGAF